MLAAPTSRFDVPTWSEHKVHPDHHVQMAHALYSAPTTYLGQQLDPRRRPHAAAIVRADGSPPRGTPALFPPGAAVTPAGQPRGAESRCKRIRGRLGCERPTLHLVHQRDRDRRAAVTVQMA
jgi:hypothetical protein